MITEETALSAVGADAETESVHAPTVAAQSVHAWELDEDNTAELADDRRPWRDVWRRAAVIVLGGVLIATFALAVFVLSHHRDRAPAPAPKPTPADVAPPAIPDGTYRIDMDTRRAVFSGRSAPVVTGGGEISTSWWAFHSACTATQCTVTGIRLDDIDHQAANPNNHRDVMTFVNGRWQENATILAQGACSSGGSQAVSSSWVFQPVDAAGVLRGVQTQVADVDGCAMVRGDTMQSPLVATRVGPIPPGAG